jgi:hypothetical protein
VVREEWNPARRMSAPSGKIAIEPTPTEIAYGYCTVCGTHGAFRSDVALDFP